MNNPPAIIDPNFTSRELAVLEDTESRGARPVAPSLAESMFNLFLEGYTCEAISKQGKGLTEGDILYCRKKYKWDEKRDRYMQDLYEATSRKIMKQKSESVDFLTGMLSVVHKKNRDQIMKYLQSGSEEDFPEFAVGNLKNYKEVVEILAKITGEGTNHKVTIAGGLHNSTSVTVQDADRELLKQILEPENAARFLNATLAATKEDKT